MAKGAEKIKRADRMVCVSQVKPAKLNPTPLRNRGPQLGRNQVVLQRVRRHLGSTFQI